MIRLPIKSAKDGRVLKTKYTMNAEPSQVISTPAESRRLITVEVREKSLMLSVRPPSKRIIPTASETIIGRNSPSALESRIPIPSDPSTNPPSSRRTIVGKCSLLESAVRRHPAPTDRQSAQSACCMPATAKIGIILIELNNLV